MSGLGDLLGGLLGKGGKGGNLGGVLAGLTGGSGGKQLAALLPVVAGLLSNGGLEKLLAGFNAKGLSAQADSWLSTGENEPVTGDQVREVVGDDEVGQIAQKLGVSNEEAAQELALLLPQIVDKASPDGQLKPQAELDSAFDQLQQAAVPAA
jgi:uncharacterized protein YidB (DUF937 family)